jgi:hypothetical protein
MPPSTPFRVEAEIVRQGDSVTLAYVVGGDVARLLITAPAPSERANELWRTTCFEAFIRAAGSASYLELNLAPSGRWAAYRFDSCRKGMRHAELATPPKIETVRDSDHFELRATLGVDEFPPPGAQWRVGLTAVIEEAAGAKSYFALAHPSGKPDFHDSRGFALEVPP